MDEFPDEEHPVDVFESKELNEDADDGDPACNNL